MKSKHLFLALMVAVIAFPACDKITNPFLPTQQNSTLPSRTPDYRDSSATSGPYKYQQYKMLLEDCMGNQCSNCPTAVAIADTLISPTGGNPNYAQIVMIEENMGFDAVPGNVGSEPSYAFSTDYRSVAGNYWNTTYFPFTAYPAGMINRRDWTQQSHLSIDQNYQTWQDTINAIFSNSPKQVISINIHDSCWVPERIIGVAFTITGLSALPALLPGSSYNLVTLIVENPIISWQEDEFVAGGFDSTYHHTNVLRGAFGNYQGGLPTGVAIPDSVVYNKSIWTSYQTYDFTKGENYKAGGNNLSPIPWNIANCYIVAFVYNTTNLEVLQAEMIQVE